MVRRFRRPWGKLYLFGRSCVVFFFPLALLFAFLISWRPPFVGRPFLASIILFLPFFPILQAWLSGVKTVHGTPFFSSKLISLFLFLPRTLFSYTVSQFRNSVGLQYFFGILAYVQSPGQFP